MEVKVRKQEFVPFMAMVIMEACTIALTIIAKTALTGGMSPFVFVVYTNALGSILLLPFSLFFHRNDRSVYLIHIIYKHNMFSLISLDSCSGFVMFLLLTQVKKRRRKFQFLIIYNIFD